MENFAQATRDFDEEKGKMEEARDKVSGCEASMPRPDEDGGDVGPVSPEDINVLRVGDILVTDPAYAQWGPAAGAVDFSKTPGGVTDPGVEDGGAGKGGGLRAGREQVTDPPQTGVEVVIESQRIHRESVNTPSGARVKLTNIVAG